MGRLIDSRGCLASAGRSRNYYDGDKKATQQKWRDVKLEFKLGRGTPREFVCDRPIRRRRVEEQNEDDGDGTL